MNEAETISASLGMTREARHMEKFLVLGSFLTLIFSFMYKGGGAQKKGEEITMASSLERYNVTLLFTILL